MISRRDCLRHAVGSAIALSLPPTIALSADAPTWPPIIDTHQHLWDLSKFRLPWLDGAGDLKRNFLPADYATATEGLNVAAALYMEVEVVPEQRVAEAQYVMGLCDRHDGATVAAVIGGDPTDESFPQYIKQFKDERRVKGVRCPYPRNAAANARFLDNLRLLGDMGLCFDLLPSPSELSDAAKVAEVCPNTRFVLDHCGNASTRFYAEQVGQAQPDAHLPAIRKAWEEGLAKLSARSNVVCKISGVCEAGPPELASAEHAAPVVKRCLHAFGPERVIFASNWPVCLKAVTFKQWVEIVRAIVADQGDAFTRKLFHDNAKVFYGLEK